MFTGIIEELGTIASVKQNAAGALVKIEARDVTNGTLEGDSIAVNGVCLTALNIAKSTFVADVSKETLNRSTIGSLKVGSKVNLERAVTPTTRLGGHIVQGHVDGTGVFEGATQDGDFWTVRISFPRKLEQYFVFKGSVSVEGISLTIAKLGDAYFEIAVIPKTWECTNLSSLANGDAVNLEVDIIAKYVERMLLNRDESPERSDISMDKLKSLGFG